MDEMQSIMEVLVLLRTRNPKIGAYEMHVVDHVTFDFSVKLSKGSIQIIREAVQDINKGPLSEPSINKMLDSFKCI